MAFTTNPNNPNFLSQYAGSNSGGQNPPSVSSPAPNPTPITASTNVNPPLAPISSQQTGLDDFSFLSVLNNLNNGLKSNNALVDQKNLIQKNMFDQPLTPDELNKLPPDVRSIVQGGNRDQQALQLQIINDSLQGRNNSIASSIQFLTSGYEQAQNRYNTDVQNVLDYAKSLNAKPSDVMKALYPSEAARLGTSLDALAAPVSTAEKYVFEKVATTDEFGNTQETLYQFNKQTGEAKRIVGGGGGFSGSSGKLPAGSVIGTSPITGLTTPEFNFIQGNIRYTGIGNKPYIDASSIKDNKQLKAINTVAGKAHIPVIGAGSSADNLYDLQNIGDANNNLNDMLAFFTGLSPKDWVQRDLGGIASITVEKYLQSNDKAALAGTFNDLAQEMQKSISGIRGRQGGEKQFTQALEAIPKATDTLSVVQGKVRILTNFLSNRENNIVSKGYYNRVPEKTLTSGSNISGTTSSGIKYTIE